MTTLVAKKSSRRVFMEKLAELAKEVRQGAYAVKRGAINWAAWNFETNPRAMSLELPESNPFRPKVDARLTIECWARAPKDGEDQMLDDGVIDEIHDDLAEIFSRLRIAKNARGDAIVFKLLLSDAESLEGYNAIIGMQGVTFFVDVGF